jgi:competence ComEA-like helix-hairpin-helix protein
MRTPLWIIHLQHWLTLTPAEFSFLSATIGLLLLGTAGRLWIASSSPVDEDAYEEMDEQFAELVRRLKARQTGGADGYDEDGAATRSDSGSSAAAVMAGPARREADIARRTNINRASRAELMRLPGIGPALAGRIVEYRARVGKFTSVGQLREVSGIGDRKMDVLSDLVVVGHSPSPTDSFPVHTDSASTMAQPRPGARSP